jgi:hypothetical protein
MNVVWIVPAVRMGETILRYNIWSDNMNFKRPLGRPKCRWQNIVKVHIRKILCEVWAESNWLKMRSIGECASLSGSTKGGNFLAS